MHKPHAVFRGFASSIQWGWGGQKGGGLEAKSQEQIFLTTCFRLSENALLAIWSFSKLFEKQPPYYLSHLFCSFSQPAVKLMFQVNKYHLSPPPNCFNGILKIRQLTTGKVHPRPPRGNATGGVDVLSGPKDSFSNVNC